MTKKQPDLKALIKSSGATMKYVAERLELDPTTLTKYNRGTLRCPVVVRLALAYLLGCKQDDIDRALPKGGLDDANRKAPRSD